VTLLKFLAALIILVIAVPLATIAYNGAPITTSPGPLPRLATYLTSHTAETVPVSAYPEREITAYRRPPLAVLDAALAAVNGFGWTLESVDRKALSLHAVASTPVWGFKDDVVVRVKTGDDGASKLYIRSSSRVGKGDLGANTARLIRLRHAIEQRL